MARTIPTINLTSYPYLAAKMDPIFSNYVSTWKSKEGVDFLNTTHPHFNVVNKLKTRTPFSSSDIDDLKSFTAKINTIVHCKNWVNNFRQSTSLDLPRLFNVIANAISYEVFQKTLTISFTPSQLNALPHLFSMIKHCQNPDSYPILYPQWKYLNNHCGWFSSKSNEYDNLCDLYNNVGVSATDKPKHLYFAAYMEYLAYQLMNIIAPTINNYSKTKLYNLFLTYKKEIDNLLAGKSSMQNSLQNIPSVLQPQPLPPSSQPTVGFPRHPLNLILYGPPGTGKTYNTLFHALAIINNTSIDNLIFEKCPGKTSKDILTKEEYKLFKDEFDEKVKTGQIMFTTFHQSMSYEDFIEGIKPVPVNDEIVAIHENDEKSATTITQFGDGKTTINNLSRMKYEVKDGVFKKMCDLGAFLKNAKDKEIKFVLHDGEEFIVDKIGGKTIYCKDSKKEEHVTENIDDLIDELEKRLKAEPKLESEQELNDDQNPIINPNIVPNHNQPNDEIKHIYPCHKAIIDKFLERKVLIIDEINRGNVAQIFGELITLIEENKRLGNKEAMTATLPYSQKPFSVPKNLYIIGTMNTADRSVEALDTALRRRFSFEEMMPKPELLKDEKQIPLEVCGVKLCDLLATINARIVALKDSEHQIGHSYFMGSEKETNKEEWLKNVFKDKIIPLLQEYFYGDYKKIYYVLGPGFVEPITDNNPENIFPVKIDDDFDIDQNITRYEIKSIDENNIEEAVFDLLVSNRLRVKFYKEGKRYINDNGKEVSANEAVRMILSDGTTEGKFQEALEEKFVEPVPTPKP